MDIQHTAKGRTHNCMLLVKGLGMRPEHSLQQEGITQRSHRHCKRFSHRDLQTSQQVYVVGSVSRLCIALHVLKSISWLQS